jgi:phenylpropionate dioxygenase-like ring-hydroxylating dioxygenase large terminal subunit
MNDIGTVTTAATEKPVVIPIEAYVSQAYARAENEKLWAKVWQDACREEEIPNVGDYVTYDILDESILIVRSAPGKISAYYNVCQHRGRRLTEGCGQARAFRCKFHGWSWGLDGKNTFVLDPEDWGKCLTPDNIRLKEVKVDTWGGWVWINMDPNCEPLRDYLEPGASMLAMFELDKMRYRWRQWLYFPCNWKTALEAFIESYHLETTHPQMTRWVRTTWWSKAQNKCSWHGIATPREGKLQAGSGYSSVFASADDDPRISTAAMQDELVAALDASTTQTLAKAAGRLVDELPPGTSAEKVTMHWMDSAIRDDAARGVIWPKLDPALMSEVGTDWHVFPNTVILPGPTFALCYRARPNGYDPNSCIFEVYNMERFPPGQEPKTQWVYEPDVTQEKWRKILCQDFSNMGQVQKGIKSRGFMGPRPSPVQEIQVTHFHRLLAQYLGTGAPQPIE